MAGQNAAPATPNNSALVTDDSDVLMEGSVGWLRFLAFPAVPGLGCGFRHRDSHPELPWPGCASSWMHSSCVPAVFQLPAEEVPCPWPGKG